MAGGTHSRSFRTARLALGGILAALCWLFLILSGVLPTGRFFVLTLASLVIVVAYLELGQRDAALVYLAAAVLAFIWPGVFSGVTFALCFGLMPLMITFLRVRTGMLVTRLVTHIVMSCFTLLALFIIGVDRFALKQFKSSTLVVVILAMAALQLFLFVYFYILRVFEQFYLDRISPWVKRRW
ncbi:MAG TPA: hypothetical protein PKH23_01755 [Bacillota bacterium]|nr:hypothetical protein [Bacillota bacterium]